MSRATQRDLTDLLIAWRDGDETALAELMPRVYRQLKRMAAGLLRSERPEARDHGCLWGDAADRSRRFSRLRR